MTPIVPCKNCKDRILGCHSSCKAYADYKAEKEVRNQRAIKQREYENFHMDMIENVTRKVGKRK